MTARKHAITPGLTRRIVRRLTPLLARRDIKFKLNQPIISISFDDFPQSVMDNALPLLDEHQWKATFYVAAGLEGITNHLGRHFDAKDIKKLVAEGHEIGCHSYSHINILEVSDDDLKKEIDLNAAALEALGVPPLTSFAYPYGETAKMQKQRLETQFSNMRGIMPGMNYNKADLNQIKSMQVYNGADIDRAIKTIKSLDEKPGWLTLFTHDVRSQPSEYGCTTDDFMRVCEAITQSGAEVLPISRAVDLIQKNKTDLQQPRKAA